MTNVFTELIPHYKKHAKALEVLKVIDTAFNEARKPVLLIIIYQKDKLIKEIVEFYFETEKLINGDEWKTSSIIDKFEHINMKLTVKSIDCAANSISLQALFQKVLSYNIIIVCYKLFC